MPYCLSFKTASPETSIGDESLPNSALAISAEGTISSPINAPTPSPNFNLSRELAHAFQSASYNDIVSRVHVYVYDPCQGQDHLQVPPDLGDRTERHLSQVLQPNKDSVQEALSHAKPTTLTHLISTYFEYSENAARDCLKLYQSVHSARNLYTPLSDLLEILPTDSQAIDESQCNLAFDIFLKVDTFENPFSSPDSYNFRETQLCFSQLRNKLDSRLHKSRSRVRLIHHATAGSALCLVAAVVGVAASAAFIASHALPTLLVAGPLCSPYLPHSFKKKELSNISKLDAAAKGTFVLNNDLDTIICLVSRLHREIEYEKDFIRLGLAMGRDVYSIQEIVKNLRKSHINVTDQLKDLEKHICLWFTHNNDTRLSLLKQINLPQTHANL